MNSILELREKIDNGSLTTDELFNNCVESAKKYQDKFNSFVTIMDRCECVDSNSILSGIPHLNRILTVAGDGFGKNGVVTLPYGTPWRTVLETMQFKSGAYETKVNSLLNGEKAVGAMSGRAEAVFASMPVHREEEHCISCGKCAQACPMKLQPHLILGEKSYLSAKHLASVCIGCGCCEYICPSALRLPERIRRYQA